MNLREEIGKAFEPYYDERMQVYSGYICSYCGKEIDGHEIGRPRACAECDDRDGEDR